jgi:hypothetical protein
MKRADATRNHESSNCHMKPHATTPIGPATTCRVSRQTVLARWVGPPRFRLKINHTWLSPVGGGAGAGAAWPASAPATAIARSTGDSAARGGNNGAPAAALPGPRAGSKAQYLQGLGCRRVQWLQGRRGGCMGGQRVRRARCGVEGGEEKEHGCGDVEQRGRPDQRPSAPRTLREQSLVRAGPPRPPALPPPLARHTRGAPLAGGGGQGRRLRERSARTGPRCTARTARCRAARASAR